MDGKEAGKVLQGAEFELYQCTSKDDLGAKLTVKEQVAEAAASNVRDEGNKFQNKIQQSRQRSEGAAAGAESDPNVVDAEVVDEDETKDGDK